MLRVPAVSIKVSNPKGTTSVLPSLVQRTAITRSTLTCTNLKRILKARSLFIPSWIIFWLFHFLDETNAALTSQTLNADGTPKRPMNAFMIFARRRRPQVSSENQAMRTGEISKLLSKEWVSMPSVNTTQICFGFKSFSLASSMKNSSTLNKPNSSKTHSIRNTLTMFIADDLTIQGNAGVPTLAWDPVIIAMRLTMPTNWEVANWKDRPSTLTITLKSWATLAYDHRTQCPKASSTNLNIIIISASRDLGLHIHHQIIQTVHLTLGYHMDLPVMAASIASYSHWPNLVIWCNRLISTIPTPKLNINFSPPPIMVWRPKDGHLKLSACSQPGLEIMIDSLGRWLVTDKVRTLRQHLQAHGQIPLTVLRLHPPLPTTSQPLTHHSIQTNLASLTIQSPLHTLCQRLHPYMNPSVTHNLICCRRNMLRVSIARTVLFILTTRIPVRFPILRGIIYLEFKLPWIIQFHSHRRRCQALVIIQDTGWGSNWSVRIKYRFLCCIFLFFL